MRYAPIFILSLGLPAAANAACAVETLVSCQVENGKVLEVCIAPAGFANGGGFTYSFGPAGRPEIQLSVPMSAMTVTPWSGVGRSIWAAVDFPNADVAYSVWHSFDRLDHEAGLQAGVNVMQGDQILASFECVSGHIAPVFTLEDAMAAGGYCWNSDDFAWQKGGCG